MAKKVSESMSLIKEDMKKIRNGAIIAVAGAVLTYATKWVTGISFVVTIDFSVLDVYSIHHILDFTPMIAAGWATAVNVIRKWVVSTQY